MCLRMGFGQLSDKFWTLFRYYFIILSFWAVTRVARVDSWVVEGMYAMERCFGELVWGVCVHSRVW